MRARLVLVGFVALAAGCGGSPQTHASFVHRVDKACDSARTQVGAVPRPAAITEVAGFLARTLPILRTERKTVASLDAPSRDRAQRDALARRWDEVLVALDQLEQGAQAGDDARVAFGLKRAFARNSAAARAARELGLAGACTRFSPFAK